MFQENPPSSSLHRQRAWMRWTILSLNLCGAVLAPAAVAQEKDKSSCQLGSRFLTFSSSVSMKGGWVIGVSARNDGKAPAKTNGGASAQKARVQPVVVDTGSAVLAIPMSLILNPEPLEDLPKPAATQCVTYSSSGNMLVGEWVRASISFFDGDKLQGTAQGMPVLGVRYACHSPKAGEKTAATPGVTSAARVTCPKHVKASDICTEVDDTSRVGMMGVQFGHIGVSPEYNALRQLARSIPDMSPGYIFTASSLQVGLTEETTKDFTWFPLKPSRTSTQGFSDWQSPSGCFRIGTGAPSPKGSLLVDTGLEKMYLEAPKKSETPNPGTPISVLAPCDPGATPVLSYTFEMPGGTGAAKIQAPSEVHLKDSQNVFINTGRHLLEQWDYAYDAQCGRVGFRKVKKQEPATSPER